MWGKRDLVHKTIAKSPSQAHGPAAAAPDDVGSKAVYRSVPRLRAAS